MLAYVKTKLRIRTQPITENQCTQVNTLQLTAEHELNPQTCTFLAELQAFTHLHSSTAEIDALPSLCNKLNEAAAAIQAASPSVRADCSPELRTLLELTLEVLFLPNSRPLHRLLLSALRPLLTGELSITVKSIISDRMAAEWALMESKQIMPPPPNAPAETAPGNSSVRRGGSDEHVEAHLGGEEASDASIPCASAWAVLLWYAPAATWIEGCAAHGLLLLSYGIKHVVALAEAGAHIPPSLSEELQVSDTYALSPTNLLDLSDSLVTSPTHISFLLRRF